jgi:HD-GYP domain-containing protein (c-di-GMP phosphodiesterase class II)
MDFGSRSFGMRASLLAGMAVAGSLGMVAGACGSVWLAGLTIAVAIVSAFGLARMMGQSFERLTSAAGDAARTGCMPENFPGGSVIQEFNRLASMLNLASRAVHHSQADLEHAHLQFIETMAQVLDARDPYTAGHSLRVGSYAYAIARAMNLPAAEAQTIRVAAQLHDIGKVGIPDAVLQKPGRLTAEEFGLVKLHPQIGRRILEKMGKFQDFLPVVELHHENHDGSGYPYRLAGDKIPLAARIVHVADAFDAMVTHRHYRDALTVARAVHELRVNAGTQFDPAITKIILRLIEEGALGEIEQSTDGLLRTGELPGVFHELDPVPVHVRAQ